MTGFWTDERVERLKILFAEGKSDSLIAIELGASRNTVCGKRARLGIKRGPNNPVTQGNGRPSRARRAGVKITPAATVVRHRTTLGQLEPLIALRSVDINPLRIPFAELMPDDCRYPDGEPATFCGHPKIEGSSYCLAHHALCCGRQY